MFNIPLTQTDWTVIYSVLSCLFGCLIGAAIAGRRCHWWRIQVEMIHDTLAKNINHGEWALNICRKALGLEEDK